MKQVLMQEMKIPAVALGTWTWGFGGMVGADEIFGYKLGAQELRPVFDYAMSKNLTLWDTASVYASGASETILGEFVKDRDDAIISTKFTPFLVKPDDTDEIMMSFLDASRERLHKDVIDIYWIHNTQEYKRWLGVAVTLLRSGKIKKLGVSNFNLEQIKYANGVLKEAGFRLHALQNHYSLIYTHLEDTGILKYCKDEDITIFSYMILEQGALGGKYTKDNPLPANTRRAKAFPPETLAKLEPLFDELRALSKAKNATVGQIVIAHSIIKGTVPIVGVTKKEQIDDCVRASEINLSAQEMENLERAAKETGVSVKGEWEVSL